MFKLPDAEGGEEKGLGSGEGAGSGHRVFPVAVTIGIGTWAPGFFPRLSFADGPRDGMSGDGSVAIHNFNIISTYRNN